MALLRQNFEVFPNFVVAGIHHRTIAAVRMLAVTITRITDRSLESTQQVSGLLLNNRSRSVVEVGFCAFGQAGKCGQSGR